jgi:putative acetyltransferase
MDRPRASAVASAVTIRRAQPQEHEALVQIWLRSVTATHAFLQPGEIEALLPAVREQALPAPNLWVLAAGDGRILGFLELARRLQGAARTPLRVDVNEQNPEAVKFYEACGFKVTGRSPVDSAGRPYPLLHMEETAKP